MSVVLNFKILDSSKLDTITSVLNQCFSISKFEIGDFNICTVVILTDKSYAEIRERFRKSLFLHDENIEFITPVNVGRQYFDN